MDAVEKGMIELLSKSVEKLSRSLQELSRSLEDLSSSFSSSPSRGEIKPPIPSRNRRYDKYDDKEDEDEI